MTEPPAQLYLIAPPHAEPLSFAPLLETALGGGAAACVLLAANPREADLAQLVRLVQSHGAAAVLATGDWELAKRTGADGVHIDDLTALTAAVRRVKPGGIVGAGRLSTRDDAMAAGESGVDYVMLGDGPDESAFEDRLDRVGWWAEIFQVPCVAIARHADEIAPLAAAGAEFVAVGDVIWNDPAGPAAAVAKAGHALREGHAAFVSRQAEQVG